MSRGQSITMESFDIGQIKENSKQFISLFLLD